jgi:hypothetical protein
MAAVHLKLENAERRWHRSFVPEADDRADVRVNGDYRSM